MKAIQIVDLTGPDSALELVDLPEPEPTHMLSPGEGVVIDARLGEYGGEDGDLAPLGAAAGGRLRARLHGPLQGERHPEGLRRRGGALRYTEGTESAPPRCSTEPMV